MIGAMINGRVQPLSVAKLINCLDETFSVNQNETGASLGLEDISFLPPIDPGSRIFCVGRNYAAHAAELGTRSPVAPSLFTRTHESLVGHLQTLSRPAVSTEYDFEGEIALIMRKRARNVSETDALSYIGGYTIFMDGSIRDFQSQSLFAGKNFDRSGACGPWVLDARSVTSPDDFHIQTRLNARLVQNAAASEMERSPASLVSYLSTILELRPGDIISTGSPSGVGMGRTPPIWLQAGDEISVEVDQIGTLTNKVGEASKC